MSELKDRTAIVTGAARGIGRATAIRLAGLGASVIATDIDGEALAAVIHEITRQSGRACGIAGNLTDPDFPDQLVASALAQFGGLDVIVNNAGYTWDSVIQKTSDEQFRAMLEIHTVVPFRILRAASDWIRTSAKKEAAANPKMRKVVNVTSISGIDGNPGQVGYSTGKAAIIGLTRTLAKEWGRYGVNVNAVAFGLIDTRLTKAMDEQTAEITIGESQVKLGMTSDVREQTTKQIPLGRVGTVDEAASCILFLCSSLSDYVTGEVLICSGGLHF